jgi:tripartite-type tricarboxylate transporter receptor subunit TctC
MKPGSDNILMHKILIAVTICLVNIGTSIMAEISDECRSAQGSKNATILVPYSAGGGFDSYARTIAPYLGAEAGLNVRVVNNSAGGGRVADIIAIKSLNDDEIILLIGNMLDHAFSTVNTDSNILTLEALDVLAIIHSEPRAWVLGEGLDILSPDLNKLVAADNTVEDAIIQITLTGMALGIETDIVAGYGGSSEYVAAVLRKEVDMTTTSLQTAIKRTKGNEASVAFIINKGELQTAPGVPFLAGEGGIADIRSRSLSISERSQRLKLAETAANLTKSVRTISISANAPKKIRNCLRDALERALKSESLGEELRLLGRPLTPIYGTEAVNNRNGLLDAVKESKPLISELLSNVMKN